MTKWLTDIEQGVFRCANLSCPERFSLADEFLSHLHDCKEGEMNDYILKVNLLICPWCDEDVKITNFPEHFREIHFQVRKNIFLWILESKKL